MATEKWTTPSAWANAFSSATLNSITSAYSILSDVAITNGSDLNMFADLQIYLASAAFAAPNFIGVFLYPLVTVSPSPDVSYYGDGRFATAAAGVPSANYAVGSIGLVAGTQVQSGMLTRIVLPPGTFKFVLYNGGGVNLASAGNGAQYRTYNRVIV